MAYRRPVPNRSLSSHLARRLADLVSSAAGMSENQAGKKAGVSPRTIANYKAMAEAGSGPSGASLAKVDKIAASLKVDPLYLLSDLSAGSLALARAFQAFTHEQKDEVYLYLLNVLEGRAVLVLPESRTVPAPESQPTQPRAAGQ